MTLYMPMVVMTNTEKMQADKTKFADLAASISCHGVKTSIAPIIVDSYMTLFLPETLSAGQYVIEYSFTYDSIPNAGSIAGKLEIVKDNAQSNWASFISDGIAPLDDQIFIAGNMMSDAELERLKAQYIAKAAQADSAKAAADASKAEADAVAYNAAHTLTPTALTQIVKDATEGLEVDLAPVMGELQNTSHGLSAIKQKVDKVIIDLETQDTGLIAVVGKIWGGVNGIFNKLTDFIKVAPTKSDLTPISNAATGAQVNALNAKNAADAAKASADDAVDQASEILDQLDDQGHGLWKLAADLTSILNWVNNTWASFKTYVEENMLTTDDLAELATSAEVGNVHSDVMTIAGDVESESFGLQAQSAKLDTLIDSLPVKQLTVPNTTASQQIMPNVVYFFAERSSALTITFGAGVAGNVNEYHLFIQSVGEPTITWPTGISWNLDERPTIQNGKTYEISILNNIAAFFEV